MPTTMQIFAAIHAKAHAAGMQAGSNVTFVPIEDNVCKFAGVVVKGNTPFGRYVSKERIGRSRERIGRSGYYPSGLLIKCDDFGKSLVRKEAYSRAYLAVLRDHGIDGYVGSRMD